MSAREQVARLLALVPLIAQRGELSVTAAAAELGVPADQLVADLRVLVFCGLPGFYPGDLIDVDLDALDRRGMIRIDNADYLSRPLRLSSGEAAALMVALRVLRDSAVGDTGSLDSALAKVSAVVNPASAPVEVLLPAGAFQLQQRRRLLESAVATGRQLSMTYHVPARDQDMERLVDPIAVLDRDATAYLVAWCHAADQRRTFRIDRIVAAEVLDAAVDPHAETPDRLLDRLLRPSPDDELVTLRLDRAARWVAEYHPLEASREEPDGGLSIDLRVSDPRWLHGLLLRLTPHVSVTTGREHRQRYLDEIAATRALYVA